MAAKKKPVAAKRKKVAPKKPAVAKKAAARKLVAKKAVAKKAAAKKVAPQPVPLPPRVSRKVAPPKPPAAERPTKWEPGAGISEFFPHEMLREQSTWLCLACILDVFTRHLGMAAKAAQKLIRAHKPSVDELTSGAAVRPYFDEPARDGNCPHCHSPAKWHARLRLYRVEGGKATDAARRELVKHLPTSKGQYEFLDQKSTGRQAFFEWLEHAGREFDFEEYHALLAATKLYLERREPAVDWDAEFAGVRSIRRSNELEDGWKKENGWLFLAAMIFDEVLAIQYLLSRSQKSGGITFEGRKTVQELVSRLRQSGYLRHIGVQAHEPGDVLEQLLDHLSGGDAALEFHYILDRRDFLDKLAVLKSARVPKLHLGLSHGAN